MKCSILFLLLACVSGAYGQTNASFYLATTGNDSNPGTQAAPLRPIQNAADTPRVGRTVNVREGIYEEHVDNKEAGKG